MRRPALALSLALAAAAPPVGAAGPEPVATFSIVAADPASGEVGVAVASRFFAVGAVVPYARAGVGAVATQSFANTTYGPEGLALLARGVEPEDALRRLTRADAERERRQAGMVSAAGDSATFTGSGCIAWAGGRRGRNYAVQGNILAGPGVVAAMERAFLESEGELAERLHAALAAGDAAGGDARGRQSASLLVARAGGGYGGFDDRAIDVRVDDHPDPVRELGRLVELARVSAWWNRAWTAFTRKEYARGLPLMERTAEIAARAKAPVLGEVCYDLAVLRAWAGRREGALEALARALAVNPRLAASARSDRDLEPLRGEARFRALVGAASD